MTHDPVMAGEVVAALVTEPHGLYVDGTVGEGGHARAILDATQPDGRLLGLDRDPEAIAAARHALASYGDRVRLVQACFSELPEVLAGTDQGPVDGVLLDLGLRSSALDDPERGFSFQADGPLDMRFDPERGFSAAQLLRRLSAAELETLLAAGTTRASPRRMARLIVAARAGGGLQRTGDLVRCLRAGLGRRATPKLFASVFAALRMAVNRELPVLEHLLGSLPSCIRKGGVLCVLSYQSQEDRLVKHVARARPPDPYGASRPLWTPLWTRPRSPSPDEVRRNPRARSAHLRAYRFAGPAPRS